MYQRNLQVLATKIITNVKNNLTIEIMKNILQMQNCSNNLTSEANYFVSQTVKITYHRLNSIKKETLAQVFSCEFCEISKKTFFTEHLWKTASKV